MVVMGSIIAFNVCLCQAVLYGMLNVVLFFTVLG